MAKPEPTYESDFTFAMDVPFRLDGGDVLQPVTLRYAVYGDLRPEADNVILVCHALSGSARVGDWWDDLFGPENVARQRCVGARITRPGGRRKPGPTFPASPPRPGAPRASRPRTAFGPGPPGPGRETGAAALVLKGRFRSHAGARGIRRSPRRKWCASQGLPAPSHSNRRGRSRSAGRCRMAPAGRPTR